jgi:hypothetical protein
VAEHLVNRAKQLHAERQHWEGVKQQANARLLERASNAQHDPDIGRDAYSADFREQLMSQAAAAAAHLEQIAQELARVRELQEAEAREGAALEEARREQELKDADPERSEPRREQLAKEARDKTEALRREEQLKADALQKEEQRKADALETHLQEAELRGKQDAANREALAQEERVHHDVQHPEQSDLGVVADINAEWAYVQDQIAAEWSYVDAQIHEEMKYNVGETLEAVREAGSELRKALDNPVSEKEAGGFQETKQQELERYTADEVFQAAPSEHKRLWLEEKFQEQLQAADDEFAGRNDPAGMRGLIRKEMVESHGKLRETVQQEQKIETEVNDKVAALEKMEAQTKARLEKANLPANLLEDRLQQLEAVTRQHEERLREQAEKERLALWEKERERQQEIEGRTL